LTPDWRLQQHSRRRLGSQQELKYFLAKFEILGSAISANVGDFARGKSESECGKIDNCSRGALLGGSAAPSGDDNGVSASPTLFNIEQAAFAALLRATGTARSTSACVATGKSRSQQQRLQRGA